MILVAFSLFSCKKIIEYQGPTGELKGKVYLYSTNAIINYSGVKVTLQGSNSLETLTDAGGNFAFENLPTDIYDLIITKDSFATYKNFSYQFIGGSIPANIGVIELPKLYYSTITDLEADTFSNFGYTQINITANLNSTGSYFRYYISTDPKVSYSNYQFTGRITSYSEKINYTIYANDLQNFDVNTRLYLIIYPGSYFLDTYYTDIQTGNLIYLINSNMPSDIVSFVIPGKGSIFK